MNGLKRYRKKLENTCSIYAKKIAITYLLEDDTKEQMFEK